MGSLLVICNSHAQSPSEPLIVGVTAPLTLKIETDKNVAKCNVEISIPGAGNIEKEITSPNYEAVIEITPQQEGQLNIQWNGKTKFRGFNTTPACSGTGSIVVTATASNAQVKTNAVKEVQVPVTDKVADASSKNSTTMCKVLDQDIAGSYSGGCKDGLAHGEGVAKWVDEYRGMFVDGKIHGKGTYAMKDGHKYVGDFVDGKHHGKGTFTLTSGDKYEGDFVDGKQQGKGTYAWQNGTKYEGDFVDGKIHGKGTLTAQNGDKHVGDFVGGKFQGSFAATKGHSDAELPNDGLIEKAWACDPTLDSRRIVDWKSRQTKSNGQLETIEEGLARLSKTLLEFRGCPNQDDTEQMRKAFIGKYVCGWLTSKDAVYAKRYGKFPEDANVIINDVDLCGSTGRTMSQYYYDENSHKEARVKSENNARQSQLKAGSVPVSNFKDAFLLLDPKELSGVMNSPLLRPDNALYAAIVTLDMEEGESLLRVKIGGYRHPFLGWINLSYATLRLTKKTIDYSQNGMRIGGSIKVIGRYVQNKKYKTITGEEKTMPVIEVMYIGA